MDTPFEKLSQEHQNIILYGSHNPIKMHIKDFGTNRYVTRNIPFVGVIPFLEKRYNDTNGDYWKYL